MDQGPPGDQAWLAALAWLAGRLPPVLNSPLPIFNLLYPFGFYSLLFRVVFLLACSFWSRVFEKIKPDASSFRHSKSSSH